MNKLILFWALIVTAMVTIAANTLNTGVIVDNWTIDADGLVSTSSMSMQATGNINISGVNKTQTLSGNYINLTTGSMSQNISSNYNRLIGGSLSDTVSGSYVLTASGSMTENIAGNVYKYGVAQTGAYTGLYNLSLGSYSMAVGANRLISQDSAGALQIFGTSANVSMISGGTIALRPDGNLLVAPGSSGAMAVNANMSIGASTAPRSNTALELLSATGTKGLLPPIATTTERDAISGPPTGLVVYNSTTNKLNSYNGSAWEEVTAFTGSGWRIDANISSHGSGTNPALSFASDITYTRISNSSLALTNNSGSATARIACDTTEAPSGLTCTGNETFGIAFQLPQTGVFRCCSTFNYDLSGPATSSAQIYFQLVSTSSQSTTILANGNAKAGFTENATDVGVSGPVQVCGVFDWSSVSINDYQVVSIYYNQDLTTTGGNYTSNKIATDDVVLQGDRNIHFMCEKF